MASVPPTHNPINELFTRIPTLPCSSILILSLPAVTNFSWSLSPWWVSSALIYVSLSISITAPNCLQPAGASDWTQPSKLLVSLLYLIAPNSLWILWRVVPEGITTVLLESNLNLVWLDPILIVLAEISVQRFLSSWTTDVIFPPTIISSSVWILSNHNLLFVPIVTASPVPS